jgi:hypothetical protein
MRTKKNISVLSIFARYPILAYIAVTYLASVAILFYLEKWDFACKYFLYFTFDVPFTTATDDAVVASIVVMLFVFILYLYSRRFKSNARLHYVGYVIASLYWLSLVWHGIHSRLGIFTGA